MSTQINREILKALLEASNTAEKSGEFILADHSDALAMRVAQLSKAKNIVAPVLKYVGNDQAAAAIMAPVGNAIGGKGLSFDDALTDTPSTMIGIGKGNYIQSYLSSPTAWLMDLIPATNKLRFMNMIRSELISSGFTELTDNRIWNAFVEQKGQHGLESLVRQYSQQADRILGPVKNVADAESRLGRMAQWIKNIPSNQLIGMRRFFVRNFGSLAPSKGGFNLSNERTQRALEYIKKRGVNNADDALSTQDLIKQNRLNLDDHGFDRTKLENGPKAKINTPKGAIKGAIKGVNSVTGKVTSAEAMVQSVANNLKNNPGLMQKFLAKAGKTEEGAKWISALKATKDSAKLAKGLKVLGKIAVFLAVLDIVSTLPAAMQGDARAQADVAINTAGIFFPPLAIANALTGLFGLDLSDMLVTNAESLGETASGVDMAATREDLINAGMTYNPQTKEWEGGGHQLSNDSTTGKSFESGMMNMVKSGMSINQAWAITLNKMKSSGASQEEILAAREKYNQAKTMIYNDGMIGSVKAPVWDADKIAKFEQSLNKHLVAKLQSGTPYNDLVREVDSYMRKVPNLRMISAIRSRVINNLNEAQKSVSQGVKSTSDIVNQVKQDNSLMSIAHRSRGARVSNWQRFLAQNGFFPDYNQKTPPVFGPRTTRSTKAFQAKYNLTVDGIVGPETLGKARQLGGKL